MQAALRADKRLDNANVGQGELDIVYYLTNSRDSHNEATHVALSCVPQRFRAADNHLPDCAVAPGAPGVFLH